MLFPRQYIINGSLQVLWIASWSGTMNYANSRSRMCGGTRTHTHMHTHTRIITISHTYTYHRNRTVSPISLTHTHTLTQCRTP